jgi:hypothetical protein
MYDLFLYARKLVFAPWALRARFPDSMAMRGVRACEGVAACCTWMQNDVRSDMAAEAPSARVTVTPETRENVVTLGGKSAGVEKDEVRVEAGAWE